jgi:hypothetical protein
MATERVYLYPALFIGENMNPRLFLKVMILFMVVFALICLILPVTIASGYTRVMHPLALLIGAVLSQRVASIYQSELRKAFIFLSLFLFLMMLAHIDPFMALLSTFGDLFPLVVLIMQWITYAMLVLCSLCVLKVTELREISKRGGIAITVVSVIGILIVTYHIPSLLQQIFVFHYAAVYTLSLLLIRLADAAIVIMLVPVVILYAQQMKLEGRESITFTAIIGGIILSLTAAYVYEIGLGMPLHVVKQEVYHTGSILDALYLFSYLMIAAGLYVHKRYDEWGFALIEQALGRLNDHES